MLLLICMCATFYCLCKIIEKYLFCCPQKDNILNVYLDIGNNWWQWHFYNCSIFLFTGLSRKYGIQTELYQVCDICDYLIFSKLYTWWITGSESSTITWKNNDVTTKLPHQFSIFLRSIKYHEFFLNKTCCFSSAKLETFWNISYQSISEYSNIANQKYEISCLLIL